MSKDFDREVTEFFKNYQDRGMVKWMGFYLSDHVAKINQRNRERVKYNPKKSEMTQDEIGQILFEAFSQHKQVSVQLSTLSDETDYLDDIVGFVNGYHDDQLIVISDQIIDLEEINHVKIL